MSFGSRLREKREELGLKQSELGKLLGITGSAIGNYENGISSPKADILYRVFDVLKCDANYLFQDEMKELQADDLTVPEIQMIKKYRVLDQHGQEAVTAILDIEFKRAEQKLSAVDNNVIYPTRYFLQAASAGTGEFSADDFEDLDLIKRPPAGTTYIVHVAGDSMEPTFSDGDKLFVSQQQDIRVGEIGIFNQDGHSYVKELGHGVLLSHNSAYSPLPLDSTIRCQGKVLGVCTDDYLH